MPSTDRRNFLKTTAVGATAATVATALSTQRARGASRRTRLALIGCGGRGSGIIRDFARLSDVDQQFPDTQYVAFDYPGDGPRSRRRQLVFEMRLWSRYGLEGIDNGNAFYGTDGWMLLSKRGILKRFDVQNRPQPIPDNRLQLTGHFQNFVDAIRGDDQPRAGIETGHLSASLCHLGNIATRLGRSLHFDPQHETIKDDPEASELLGRTYRAGGHWAIPPGV